MLSSTQPGSIVISSEFREIANSPTRCFNEAEESTESSTSSSHDQKTKRSPTMAVARRTTSSAFFRSHRSTRSGRSRSMRAPVDAETISSAPSMLASGTIAPMTTD